MALIDDIPGIGDTTPGAADAALLSWINAAVRGIIAAWNSPDLSPTVSYLTAEADSEKKAVDVTSLVALWEDVSKHPQKLAGTLPDGAFAVIAWILRRLTGLTISGPQIEALFDAATMAESRSGLGKILTDLYAETLKTDKVAAGWVTRLPGDAELENFRQLSGAAMRLALGGLLAEWGKGILPLGLGGTLENIAEKLNDAVALDDALEEIVQVPMQAVIQRGLEARYNRELKPVDLSANQALQAEIAGKLKPGELSKILDNAGYRDDIRPFLREQAASNLTESDLQDAYNRGMLTRGEVKANYKNKYFEEPDAELKTKLLEGDRRKKLEEKVYELWGNLYRDGVASKEEVRPHLNAYGLKPEEQDLWFLVQELERRQRKWLSTGALRTLTRIGAWTDQQAIDYLLLQGMTQADASEELRLNDTLLGRGDILRLVASGEMSPPDGLTRMLLLGYASQDAIALLTNAVLEDAIAQIPKKIRDECQGENYQQTVVTRAIQVALALNPEALLTNNHFFVQAKCILEKLVSS